MEAPVSGRWALVQSAQFVAELDLSRPEAESYLLPLAEPLAGRAADLNPVGLRPGPVKTLADRLRAARAHHPALDSLEAMGQAEHALRRRAALLYAYAGATQRAFACLQGEARETPLPAALDADRPRDRFEEARRRADTAAHEADVRWMAAHWDGEEAEEEAPVASVPVVERSPDWMQGRPLDTTPVGALRHLRVDLYGSAESADRLQMDVAAYGADADDPAAAPLAAARQLLDDQHPPLRGRYVQGRLLFDHTQLRHRGRSAGLAVAALFYGAVLDYSRRRRRLQLRPAVAVTGEVAADGRVTAVDGNTLSTKVQTAFFSPKTALVVPAAQADEAGAARDALRDEFPHGRLDIVGVERLDGLFYDRRLTRERRIGWARHVARRLWDRRAWVGAGAVIAALLLVIAALLYGPIDTNPAAVAFDGKKMLLKNERGRVVERIPVGAELVQSAKRGGYEAYRLGDLDGNGQNEVCWGEFSSNDQDVPSRLKCKAVSEDTLRWSIRATFDVPFPRKPAISTEEFHPGHVRIGDFDANGRAEVIATFYHNTYFPALVLKLDARTGRELGRYVHAGHLYSAPRVTDLNGDGVQEILLTGVSNAYGQAIVTVLDARFIDGHGPTRGDYVMPDLKAAREIAYLRIPPTVVDRAQPRQVNKGNALTLYESNEQIEVKVLDGRHRDVDDRRSSILIYLNHQFEAVAVGSSSQYDRLARRLKQEGRIESIPDYAYFQAFTEQVRYWTGTSWAQTPTISARWRAAADTNWTPRSTATSPPDSSSIR